MGSSEAEGTARSVAVGASLCCRLTSVTPPSLMHKLFHNPQEACGQFFPMYFILLSPFCDPLFVYDSFYSSTVDQEGRKTWSFCVCTSGQLGDLVLHRRHLFGFKTPGGCIFLYIFLLHLKESLDLLNVKNVLSLGLLRSFSDI